jgi:Holliday junction resolvase RusA-like endonuclease
MRELLISVPLVPPSVNHYKRPIILRGHISFTISKAAREYKRCVAIFSRGQSVADAKARYELDVVVYLGHNQRGDGDNFWKVIADGLVEACVIHSDAAVDDWILRKRRDPKNPRTEITVRVMSE